MQFSESQLQLVYIQLLHRIQILCTSNQKYVHICTVCQLVGVQWLVESCEIADLVSKFCEVYFLRCKKASNWTFALKLAWVHLTKHLTKIFSILSCPWIFFNNIFMILCLWLQQTYWSTHSYTNHFCHHVYHHRVTTMMTTDNLNY